MDVIVDVNLDLALAEEIKKLNIPVFVYGSGEIGQSAKRKLIKYGIAVTSFIVDNEFDRAWESISVEVCNSKYDDYVVILGFLESYYNKRVFAIKFPNARIVARLADIGGFENIDASFFETNKYDFERFYHELSDELSKQSFSAYLNSKVNKSLAEMKELVVLPQYTPTMRAITGEREAPFLKLRKDEVLVNCGAYDGDTIKSFLEVLGTCKNIYALEPDPSNVSLLRKYVEENSLQHMVKILETGVSNRKDTLRFNAGGGMKSSSREDGESIIHVDTIDSLIGHAEVTFINMDIEGAEMEALIGAESTIRRNRPIMAISAYHKRRDCIDIPAFLKRVVPEYKFYFRLHKPLAIDAVLYATCR